MPARRLVGSALLVLALVASPASAVVNPGQAAPTFTKTVLGGSPWPTATLSQFAGQVLVLHLIGYD